MRVSVVQRTGAVMIDDVRKKGIGILSKGWKMCLKIDDIQEKVQFSWVDFPNPCSSCFPCSRNVLLEFHSVIEQRGMHPYEGRGGEGEEGEEGGGRGGGGNTGLGHLSE